MMARSTWWAGWGTSVLRRPLIPHLHRFQHQTAQSSMAGSSKNQTLSPSWDFLAPIAPTAGFRTVNIIRLIHGPLHDTVSLFPPDFRT